MKNLFYVLVVLMFAEFANAQLIREAEPVDYHNTRTASQIEVGKYRPDEKELNFVLEHYTDGELRNYARVLNMQQIEEAKAAGKPVPEKISEEILQDRAKLAEYIRSCYNLPY